MSIPTYGASVELLESFGSILESAFFERLLHGQIRPGFILGTLVMIASAVMMCIVYMLNPDIHSNSAMAGFAFSLGIGFIGSLIQTNTDIEDQEAGRYSKMGSGWNLWGDNIIFNQITQCVLVGLIFCSFGASIYYFNAACHQQPPAKVARVAPQTNTHAPMHRAAHPNSASTHHHKAEKAAHH